MFYFYVEFLSSSPWPSPAWPYVVLTQAIATSSALDNAVIH